MIDRRRYLSTFAIFALVLLRVIIGWHFFGEGTKKLRYDRHDHSFHLVFSADKEFLDKAKGPLAGWYLAFVPSDHNWRQLFATPRENVQPTAKQLEDRAKWQHEYSDRRAAATKKGELPHIEFPPSTAYHDWATRIADDWRETAAKVKAVSGISDAQKQQVDKVLNHRLKMLAEYLAGEDEAMTTYRHELYRLANWHDSDEAGDVPFYQQRIAAKNLETTGQLKSWQAQVDSLEAGYHDDLDRILTADQRNQPATKTAFQQAIADPHKSRLDKLNVAVTVLTIGVGVCLLLGFFTRLASLVGAFFLLSVVASQPFWLADSLPTMPQVIECAALLVLAGTRAGRWLGLDFFTYSIFNRFRRNRDADY